MAAQAGRRARAGPWPGLRGGPAWRCGDTTRHQGHHDSLSPTTSALQTTSAGCRTNGTRIARTPSGTSAGRELCRRCQRRSLRVPPPHPCHTAASRGSWPGPQRRDRYARHPASWWRHASTPLRSCTRGWTSRSRRLSHAPACPLTQPISYHRHRLGPACGSGPRPRGGGYG